MDMDDGDEKKEARFTEQGGGGDEEGQQAREKKVCLFVADFWLLVIAPIDFRFMETTK